MNVKTIGKLVRNARKKQGLTQAEAAGYLNVGTLTEEQLDKTLKKFSPLSMVNRPMRGWIRASRTHG